ncbi:hypothetical protein DMH17_01195 [Raoultella planticola]|nr:hypothetical protein [Raoultella planticola]
MVNITPTITKGQAKDPAGNIRPDALAAQQLEDIPVLLQHARPRRLCKRARATRVMPDSRGAAANSSSRL